MNFGLRLLVFCDKKSATFYLNGWLQNIFLDLYSKMVFYKTSYESHIYKGKSIKFMQKKKAILVLLLTIFLLGNSGFAQDFEKEKLNQYFNNLEASNKFMGSVVVSRNGQIIYTKSVGFADVESKTKQTDSTKYRIGSISKTFTAVLVLKAVEENKLQLSQTLDQYYPNIKNASRITLENMLYHRSGMHSFTSDKDFFKWRINPKTQQELVEIIAKGESKFEPNSKFEYSNPNFILLSFILEKVYNKPYSQILEEKILKPAGLTNTKFGSKINPQNNESHSYQFNEKWEKDAETDTSIPMGAGGIISTAGDLIKFGEALFNEKLITKNSLEKMSVLKDRVGMGIFLMPFFENNGYGHSGAIDGFTSSFSYFPDSKVSFALVSNGTNFNNNQIAMTVLSAVYKKPFEVPSFKTIAVTSEDLDKYLGTYSSADLPLKLTITKQGDKLIAQATGQQQLLLEATEKDVFTFDQIGLVLKFNPTEKTIVLKQGGSDFNFKKE